MMDDSLTPHASRLTPHASTPVLFLHLALVLLQASSFGALVGEGRSLDVVALPEAVYRVDGLAVVLGVGWCVGMALVVWSLGRALTGRKWVGVCFMTVGALSVSYARLPLALYLGWEAMGLGLWLAVRPMGVESGPTSEGAGNTYKALTQPSRLPGRLGTGWALHVAGWPLLLGMFLGLIGPFAPPVGGVAQAWPLPVALGMAVVALIRSGCPPFDVAWTHHTSGGGPVRPYKALLGLYTVVAPVLLARMLVAAPWDAVGGWALALVGTAALLSSVIVPALRGGSNTVALPTALSAAAISGLGLAASSPLVASGAIALVLVGMASAVILHNGDSPQQRQLRPFVLLGAAPGIWLLSQGASALGYGVVAAVLLPAIASVVVAAYRRGRDPTDLTSHAGYSTSTPALPAPLTPHPSPITTALALTILAAAYPQALAEFGLRPAVAAMAGGVGTLSALKTDWGVGLLVEAAQGVTLGALPTTGIAVAVFLAWVALYWLRGLLSHLAGERAAQATLE